MIGKNLPYLLALGLVKDKIHKKTLEKLNKSNKVTEDLVLGVKILDRFGTFS